MQVIKGEFNNIKNNPIEQRVRLKDKIKAKFIKLGHK